MVKSAAEILEAIKGMSRSDAEYFLRSALEPDKAKPGPETETPYNLADVDYLTQRLKKAQREKNLPAMRQYSEALQRALSSAPAAPPPDRAAYSAQMSRVGELESKLAELRAVRFTTPATREAKRQLESELEAILKNPLPVPPPLPEKPSWGEGEEDE